MTGSALRALASSAAPSRSFPGTLVAKVAREHRAVLTLSLAYIAGGGAILTLARQPWPIALVTWGTTFWLALSVAWLIGRAIRSPLRARTALAFQRWLGAVLVILLIVPTQITFQSLKQSIGRKMGFFADPFLHNVDVALHGGVAWRWFGFIFTHPMWLRIIDTLYMGWFVLFIGFIFWASWSGDRLRRQRALVALLLMWVVAGTMLAALGASAGPCYYERIVAGPDPYATLLTKLDAIDAGGSLWARVNQRVMWEISQENQYYSYGGISAMPSLHVGMAVLWALVAFGRSRVLGLALAGYAVVIQVGAVVLAWHYAVDGYVGALVAGLTWAAARAIVPDRSAIRNDSGFPRSADRATIRPIAACVG